MKRIDWLVAITWLALVAIGLVMAYAIGVVVVWLVQRALLLAWPFVQVNGDAIESAVLVAAAVSLGAWVLGGGGRRR